jgi:hypothetical protein
MDKDGIRPLVAQTLDGLLASMGGTVVHNPKNTASGFIRLLAHDFADKPVHRGDAALDFAAAEDLGAMDIPAVKSVCSPAFTCAWSSTGVVGKETGSWGFYSIRNTS